MDIKEAGRFTERTERSVFIRHHRGPANSNVCAYWIAGRCTRNPCRFVHGESLSQPVNHRTTKQFHALPEDQPRKSPSYGPEGQSRKIPYYIPEYQARKILNYGPESRPTKSPNSIPKKMVSTTGGRGSMLKDGSTPKSQERICDYWLSGNCKKSDKCQFLHSWFRGNGFLMLAKLGGHKKAVTGIAIPSGSDKLYSVSTDGTARLWDCHTGHCTHLTNLGVEIGSLISEGPWVFVGMPNVVKACNIQTAAEISLNGPVGQVYAMVVANDMLFAGAQDGVILVWKGSSETNSFELAAFLKGHTSAVLCLAAGGKMLYSGSMDKTIRVWDLDTSQSIMTLDGHTEAVMSLLCWDQYLLSCSLDQTIKVWAASEGGNLEVTYTHNEDHGVLALCGMNDAEAKPVLFCSCNDNSVHLYELPSFADRGRLFSRKEIREIQTGPDELFFTGDGTGMLTVWKWVGEPIAKAS